MLICFLQCFSPQCTRIRSRNYHQSCQRQRCYVTFHTYCDSWDMFIADSHFDDLLA